ncbi:MAG: hypothetical protein AAF911_03370 [Planctomycetota bacterium]
MRPARCHCLDWELDDSAAGRLAMRPSSKTVVRSMRGSVLMLILAGLLALVFGFPPGCRAVTAERNKLHDLEQQLALAEQQAQRSRAGSTAQESGSIGQRVAEQDQRRAANLQREVAQQQTKVNQTQATLGPVGDTLYWSAMGALVALAALLPILAKRERITLTLMLDGQTLRLRRRGQIFPSRDFNLERYAGLAVVVQRQLTRTTGPYGQTIDHGWWWSVLLVSAQPGVQWLELIVDDDASLPQPFDQLTTRVRRALRYLEQTTGLPAAPPVKIDVGESRDGLLNHAFMTRVEQATQPASSDPPYKPLS